MTNNDDKAVVVSGKTFVNNEYIEDSMDNTNNKSAEWLTTMCLIYATISFNVRRRSDSISATSQTYYTRAYAPTHLLTLCIINVSVWILHNVVVLRVRCDGILYIHLKDKKAINLNRYGVCRQLFVSFETFSGSWHGYKDRLQ